MNSSTNKLIKVLIVIVVIVVGLLGIAFYSFLHTDYVGHRDPVAVEASKQYFNNMLLSAEYRNGTDYCMIDLLDSTKIKISAGDKTGGVIIEPEYRIIEDTIFILNGIKQANKFMNSDKLLIKDNRIYYLLDKHGHFDTTQTMNVKFNKLKL